MLKLQDFSLRVKDKILFNNLNLTINDGEIHVLMGQNGVGKSSIAKAIMGDNNYQVQGHIYYNDEDITNLSIYERSQKGIYLLNQSPMQIEGVTNAEMLRVAVASRSNIPINIFKFNQELENICASLELDKSFIHRDINVGCSGGERKKIELLHMWMLKPSLIILDEIDSGLDVDAIKIVSKSLKKYYELYKPSIIIITHSSSLLNAFDNYYVHVLNNQKIIKSGDKTLAEDILNKGFKELTDTFVIRERSENE